MSVVKGMGFHIPGPCKACGEGVVFRYSPDGMLRKDGKSFYEPD